MRLGIIALLALPAALAAQGNTGRGDVRGTVFDSVARRPVVGALVQIASAANPAVGAHSATTDDQGRFVIAGVEPGQYIVGFHHVALDSLALEPSLRGLEVVAGKRVEVNLAVPSPATLGKAFCGRDGTADSTGVVIGMLRDAGSHTSLDTGTVEVSWRDLVLDSTGLNQYDREAKSPVVPGGWFVLCGVPADVDVTLRGWQGPDTTGLAVVSVPTAGIARYDLFIRGISAVKGMVLSERGLPVPRARIGLIGREQTVTTDSAGAFQLKGVPAGSQTLEFRALGFAPERRLLHLRPDSDTSVAITLTSMKKVMDTIQVVARRIYDLDLNGFRRRMRGGTGYFFDEETIRRRRPTDLFQLLWQVPSLRVYRNGFERAVEMRGFVGSCRPDLYLNGMRMPGDMLGDLDLIARPEELAGMEVYRGPTAPAQFTSLSGCGAIVLWTRPPPKQR